MLNDFSQFNEVLIQIPKILAYFQFEGMYLFLF